MLLPEKLLPLLNTTVFSSSRCAMHRTYQQHLEQRGGGRAQVTGADVARGLGLAASTYSEYRAISASGSRRSPLARDAANTAPETVNNGPTMI